MTYTDYALLAIRQRERDRVVRIAHEWLNTPYHTAARLKKVGCDCATLLTQVYFEAGLVGHVDLEHYPPDWFMHRSEERYLQEVKRHALEISGPPAAGDIAVWKVGRCYAHGAIVIEWPRIIHSVMGRGVLLGDASIDADLIEKPVKFFSPWA
jgi:cell wall-associated NlpC family hydrolase